MATDYPAGVYDLYMKYLNEMEQEGIASDTDSYIPQLPYIYPQGDGGQDDPPDRSWDKEYDTEDFEALALRDEYGNVKYGLSEEEQALMDRIRGKGGFNPKTDYSLMGIFSNPLGAILGTAYKRQKDKKKAERELAALVQKQKDDKAIQEVQQNIQTYGDRDRPNTGINEPGGGKGQSPTGGDVAGTPFVRGGRVGYAKGTPIADVTETEATLMDDGSIFDFLKITGGGGYGENTDIMYEGEIIPGLDQTNYGYGFDVGAEVPIGNTGLTLTGDVGIGRGSTQTDYMGENVPSLSGVGETKLGDKWNVGIEGKWPVNFNELFMEEGGRVGFLKGSPDDTKEVMETPTEPGSDKMAYFPGDVFSSSQVRALFKDRSLSTNMDRKQLYHILMNPGKYPAAESMLLRLLKQKGLQSGGLAGLPN